MGNTIFINGKKVHVKPIRIQAIQRLNFLLCLRDAEVLPELLISKFFPPELQTLLKPIYDLTRKGVFHWGTE